MGSYIDEGFYKDSDPIYQEGFSIMNPKKSKKKNSERSDRSGSKKSTNKQSEKNKNEYQNAKS